MGDLTGEQPTVGNDEQWRGKEYAFFSHKSCEMFPCHERVDADDFNCLFCYCPLYHLGGGCGGNCEFLSNGVKDCTGCTIPHIKDNYGYIISRFHDIAGRP